MTPAHRAALDALWRANGIDPESEFARTIEGIARSSAFYEAMDMVREETKKIIASRESALRN